jgi:hypothetical protein
VHALYLWLVFLLCDQEKTEKKNHWFVAADGKAKGFLEVSISG